MSDAENPAIVEGLAAIAITAAEMGHPRDEIRRQVLNMIASLGISTEAPAVLHAAAAAVARMPAPLDESSDEIERARPIREMLGVQSADEQLAAMLLAREILESLGDDAEG